MIFTVNDIVIDTFINIDYNVIIDFFVLEIIIEFGLSSVITLMICVTEKSRAQQAESAKQLMIAANGALHDEIASRESQLQSANVNKITFF